jgi:hypothetical protein
MTAEEWNKTHKDYKSTAYGGRTTMRNGKMVGVFITDKPET